jgi:hypothetical protein
MKLSESFVKRLKALAGIVKENYDDFGDEGPQPGDAEYHNEKYEEPKFNIDNINEVDRLFKQLHSFDGAFIGNYPNWIWEILINEYGMAEDINDGIKFTEEGNYIKNAVQLQKFLADEGGFNGEIKIDNSPSTLRYRDDGGTDGG